MDFKGLAVPRKEIAAGPLNFKNPVAIKEFSAVNTLCFLKNELVVASNNVKIYSNSTLQVSKQLSRFKHVNCASAHGQLLVAGDESSILVFDLSSRAILRTLLGHKDMVRQTYFSPDRKNIVSCSDDATVKVWDIAMESCLSTFDSHTDYVRTVQMSSLNPSVICSGSYDHSVRLWDSRSGLATLNMDHGAPVECVLFFPGSGLVASSGANVVKIWDILAGGRQIHGISHHQKTITDMCFDDSGSYLLTASLDQQVKVVNVQDYKVVQSFKYPSPILSVAISPTNSVLAVGMSNGLLSIRKQNMKTADLVKPPAPLRGGNAIYFGRGSDAPVDKDTLVIGSLKYKKMAKYDKYLRSFQYANALDATLENGADPDLVTVMIQELVHREGVRVALTGRDEKSLLPILKFISKHINNPRYNMQLIQVADIIIDIYSKVLSQSVEINKMIVKIKDRVKQEIKVLAEFNQLIGQLDLVFAACSA